MNKKREYFFILGILAFLLVLVSASEAVPPGAGGVEKKKILSIGAGEELMYAENCIMLDAAPDKWRVVTRENRGLKPAFYVYANGKKQGPFAVLRDDMVAACGSRGNPCAAYESPDTDTGEDMSSLMGDEEGGTVITFAGKKFGPFSQIFQFGISRDRKRFYASVADTDNKIWLISSGGLKLAVNGMPDNLIVSPSGALAFLKVVGNINPLINPEKVNFADAVMDKVTLYASDGKKYGPFSSGALSAQDIWFTKSGSHWLMAVEQQLYVDGLPFRKFAESVYHCQFWLSDDGKTWANATYEKLEFSDGSVFPYAFDISLVRSAGLSYLTWVSLEKGTDIVLYRKAF